MGATIDTDGEWARCCWVRRYSPGLVRLACREWWDIVGIWVLVGC